VTRQDVRHALRLHLKHSVLTATVVVTLALGIGANTAIFTIVNAVLLRPLDYPEPGRLARLYQTYESLRTSPNPRLRRIWNRLGVSYLNALDYRQASRTVAGIGLYTEQRVTFLGGGEPEEVEAVAVDADLFATLGVVPSLGRTFAPAEVERRERLAVLSHDLWQRVYGGDPAILERTLSLDGEPYSVVGVMPSGFHVGEGRRDRLWTPLALEERDLRERDDQRLSAVVRLAPGATIDAAREELEQVAAGQAEAHPDTNDGVGVRLRPLHDAVVGDSRPILTLLMAAAALVLALACVNVAQLLLAQAGARRGELAIRLALGASRGRLAATLLTESLILASAGGALGLLLAVYGRRALLAWIGAELPRTDAVAVDGRVLLFTLGASLAAALACGLLPAFSSSAAAAVHQLRTGPAPRRRLLAHGGFVVAEIALSLMLVAGAALLVHSFLRLAAVDPGFRVAGLLVQDVRLPSWRYPDEQRRQEFTNRLLERLAAVPGVRSAALTTKLPFAGPSLVAGFRLPDDAEGEDWTQGRSATMTFVTSGYFATLGIPLLQGEASTGEGEAFAGEREVVVNETLARAAWPGRSPVGREVIMADETHRVVGVAADVRHDGTANEPGALMYQPWRQLAAWPAAGGTVTAVLDVEGEPMLRAADVRRALRELDPSLPVPAATTMERLMADSLGTPRARTSLVSLLAALALALALVGTYAVTSFTVGQRVREIGVRMALGADARRVRALVLGRALAQAAAGIAVGTAGALALARLLEGQLYGVAATDPPTLAAAAALLAVTALAAGYLPAVRASRVDPSVALREE